MRTFLLQTPRPLELREREGELIPTLRAALRQAGLQDNTNWDWSPRWCSHGCTQSQLVDSGVFVMAFMHLLWLHVPLQQWPSYLHNNKMNDLRKEAGISLLDGRAMCLNRF